MSELRATRVAEAIKEEISDILAHHIKDPRIGFASVVDVFVSQDLRYAKVYISVLGDDSAKEGTRQGLASAQGFIRSEIARRIRLRHVPEISFVLDDSIERGDRISRLLKEITEIGERGEQ